MNKKVFFTKNTEQYQCFFNSYNIADDIWIADFILDYKNEYLQIESVKTKMIYYINLVHPSFLYRLKRISINKEAILKAVLDKKNKALSVLDATAGLGQDSCILAHAGCTMTLIEKNPITFLLLRDAFRRMKIKNIPWMQKIHNNTTLIFSDSFQSIKDYQSDVIYLDPMFPPKKKTAYVKKNIKFLQDIEEYTEHSDSLLKEAFKYSKNKIVVKRPLYVDYLLDIPSAFSIKSKKYRFDVYLKNINF